MSTSTTRGRVAGPARRLAPAPSRAARPRSSARPAPARPPCCRLVPRLYDVTGGQRALGGVDVREPRSTTLWSRIGLVPQKPYLFTGTVASNLRYGDPEATDDELWEALRIAQAEDFVRGHARRPRLPDRAGRHQRLRRPAPAPGHRAGAGRAAGVYLFDDSFSALDLPTDARLRAALRPVTRDATVIVVAQRVSTIVDADHIVVLDDGEVVGQGTHDELLEHCPTYQ